MNTFRWDPEAQGGYVYAGGPRGGVRDALPVVREPDGSVRVGDSSERDRESPFVLADFREDETLHGVEFLGSDVETLTLVRDFLASRGIPEPAAFTASFPMPGTRQS